MWLSLPWSPPTIPVSFPPLELAAVAVIWTDVPLEAPEGDELVLIAVTVVWMDVPVDSGADVYQKSFYIWAS